MKKLMFFISVVFLTSVASASAQNSSDQESPCSAVFSNEELREFALNGIPFNQVLAYSCYSLDLKTMDKDVLVMLIKNCYDACFGCYRYSSVTPGTIRIMTGFWQMQILDRPDAEEIMDALIESRAELYVGTIKKLFGDPCISVEDINTELKNGDSSGFATYREKMMLFADKVAFSYRNYVGTEIEPKKPCLITRDKTGKIIKRAEYGDGIDSRSVATPEQVRLVYLLTGRQTTDDPWLWDIIFGGL